MMEEKDFINMNPEVLSFSHHKLFSNEYPQHYLYASLDNTGASLRNSLRMVHSNTKISIRTCVKVALETVGLSLAN